MDGNSSTQRMGWVYQSYIDGHRVGNITGGGEGGGLEDICPFYSTYYMYINITNINQSQLHGTPLYVYFYK